MKLRVLIVNRVPIGRDLTTISQININTKLGRTKHTEGKFSTSQGYSDRKFHHNELTFKIC
jgi:hypothetical protein